MKMSRMLYTFLTDPSNNLNTSKPLEIIQLIINKRITFNMDMPHFHRFNWQPIKSSSSNSLESGGTFNLLTFFIKHFCSNGLKCRFCVERKYVINVQCSTLCISEVELWKFIIRAARTHHQRMLLHCFLHNRHSVKALQIKWGRRRRRRRKRR